MPSSWTSVLTAVSSQHIRMVVSYKGLWNGQKHCYMITIYSSQKHFFKPLRSPSVLYVCVWYGDCKLEHIKPFDKTEAVIMIRRIWSACAKAPASLLTCIHLLLRLYTFLRWMKSAIGIFGRNFQGINRLFQYQQKHSSNTNFFHS